MKIAFLVLGWVAVGIASAWAAPTNNPKEDISAIQNILDDIAFRLTSMDQVTTPPPSTAPNQPKRQADRELLKKVVLPPNPTKENVRTYLMELQKVSQSQYGYFDDDPQPEMLRRIPNQHADVIIENLSNFTGVLHWYAISAIEDMAQDEHKAVVLANLSVKHDLAKVVRQKGWEKDAAPVLINGLRSRPSFLSVAWIDCVARLNDPSTFADLKWFFRTNTNVYFTFGSIYETCDVDISQEIAERWNLEKNKPIKPGDHSHFQILAMTCDLPDALDRIFASEWCDDFRLPSKGYSFHAMVLRHVEATGTEAELKEWYGQNKDRLYFDKNSRKWRVKKEGQ